MTTFVIPGPPIPKGRPRMARSGHVYTPKRTEEAERRWDEQHEEAKKALERSQQDRRQARREKLTARGAP
jgi:hypothetical protein